jgi:hypothetical protein
VERLTGIIDVHSHAILPFGRGAPVGAGNARAHLRRRAGRLELSPDEVRAGVASFNYDLTAATSEAQLGALLHLVPVSRMLTGLDLPFMPRTSFAPAIADLTGSSSLDAADREKVSHGNAERLFPALKARIEHGDHRLKASEEKV